MTPRQATSSRRPFIWPLAVLLASPVVACTPASSDSTPPAEPIVAPGDVTGPASDDAVAGYDDWFIESASAVGLDFVHFNGMSGAYFFPEMIPAGVGLFDFDNDGDLDVYLVQGRMLGADRTLDDALLPPSVDDLKPGGRLFRNDLAVQTDGTRQLSFTDVTDASGIDAHDYGMAVATGDVDNDGWVDLYLTNFGENRLFRNNGDGTFADIAASSGTADPGWGVSASFLDYDRDGWLDLYVGNYVRYGTASDRPCTGLTGRRDYCTPDVYEPEADRLYRNLGNGRFDDVTAQALVGGPFGPALGVSTADFDGDGWIDIYVANDKKENLLWMNRGDGTLENRALLAGAALSGEGREEASMGVDAGDFDNDGDEDLFVTHLPSEGNNLYVNRGDGQFEDRSASSGLGPASLGFTGFGAAWFDYDNDGWLDVLAVNGAIEADRRRLDETFPYDERNLLLRNLGTGRFEDVTDHAGSALQISEVSRGAAFGDIDNDGDTDVLVTNVNGPARLLLNQIGTRHHWIGIDLTRSENRSTLGTRVEVSTGDGTVIHRRARADGSYASANDRRVLVGLGQSGAPARVRVRWPDGRGEAWDEIALDRWTVLREGDGTAW